MRTLTPVLLLLTSACAGLIPGQRTIRVAMHPFPASCTEELEQRWYFPRHHLKTPMPTDVAADPAEVEHRMAPQRCMEGAALAGLDEPILADGSHQEAYRFLWEPSFAPAVVVRVEHAGGACHAVVKRGPSSLHATEPPAWRAAAEDRTEFELAEAVLPCARFEEVVRVMDRSGCWNVGNTCEAQLSDALGPNQLGVDGDTWLLEGARGPQHWAVTVWMPKAGPFREAALAVVDAANARHLIRVPR